VRTLKELDYVPETKSIILGYSVGSAELPSGRKLTVVASGNTVRFAVEGIDGHVDLKLNGYAANAATWLEEQHEARERAVSPFEVVGEVTVEA